MKQVNKKINIFILLLFSNTFLFAQNPAIFKGGSADGWISANYLQAGSNIFKGGNADGWSSLNFSQNTTNIFHGGVADGWVSQNYSQSSSNIFKGGAGDGWDMKNFIQSDFNIFTGGIGDGWASTYRPQGPLPVTFLYFDARREGTAALLNWKTSQENNSAYFDIERSADAVNYTYIEQINAAGNSQIPLEYYFTDNKPYSGLNYYRLRQVDIDGHFIYTPSRLVRFEDINAGLVKYYPNPTNGVLNIGLPPALIKEAKVINVTNAAGIVLMQLKAEGNSDPVVQLNFLNYPKGIYFVQVKTNSANSVQRIVLQ